ncbi:hypothetical protein [uncultured Zhongshania sp.]|uniref:hypothetical protein n=1 Tax=uncultured Zhongshania sp. TaxID=1642288 RepID=UPI0030D7B6E4
MDTWTLATLSIASVVAAGIIIRKTNYDRAYKKVVAHTDAASKEFNAALELTSPTAQKRRFEKALGYLAHAEQSLNARKYIKNFQSKWDLIYSTMQVAPIAHQIAKAEKHAYKDEATQELKCYKEIMFLITKNEITDEDLNLSALKIQNESGTVTINDLRDKCIELGWTPTEV